MDNLKNLELLESNILFMNYIGYNLARKMELNKILKNKLIKFERSESSKILKVTSITKLNSMIQQYTEYRLKTSRNLTTCETKECSDYYVKKMDLIETLVTKCHARIAYIKMTYGLKESNIKTDKKIIKEAFPIIPILASIAAASGVRGYMNGRQAGKDVAEKILSADDYLTNIQDNYEYIEKMKKRIDALENQKLHKCSKTDKQCLKEFDNEIAYLKKEIKIETDNYNNAIKNYDEISNIISKTKRRTTKEF